MTFSEWENQRQNYYHRSAVLLSAERAKSTWEAELVIAELFIDPTPKIIPFQFHQV